MDISQKQKVQSQSPGSPTQPSVSWKTVGIAVGIVIVFFLLLGIVAYGRQGRWKKWREWREQRQQQLTVQPSPIVQPSPTPIPEQPTSTPVPTTPPGVSYEVSITEAEWNNGLKDEVAESQNRAYPLTSLTVSLYEGSGRVNAVWKTGAAYTAELYVDETGKELKLRYPSFSGAGTLDEAYRNAVTDVFQAEITAAIKQHFSNRLEHIELHYGKVVFYYK